MSKFVNRFACIVALCAACVLPMEAQAADKSAKDLGRAKKAVQTVKKEASVKLKDTRLTASIAWLQSSAEYKALCYQTYNMAAQAINDQIRLGSYVRVNGKLCEETLERTEDGKLMRIYHPLAIVLDVDETVVDNSGIEVWCLLNQIPYDENIWGAWCRFQAENKEACKEVPGAVSFLLYCQEMGITPIYLTDRDESAREYTRRALENLGLGTDDLDKCLILHNKKRDEAAAKKLLEDMGESATSVLGQEVTNNYSKKAGRRVEVRTKYKVLGWFGDNLYDMPVFVSRDLTKCEDVLEARNEQVKQHVNKLGNVFFILPNPIYGSWLKKETIPDADMSSVMSDYGFGPWYEKHKANLKEASGR